MRDSVPNRLREHREKTGLSQTKVGKQLKPPLSEAAVNRHERGNRKPTPELIEQYAKLYGVEPIDLFVDLTSPR